MFKEELDVISQAILNEIEGYEFYKMAANQVGQGDSKDAFMELANEELKHVEYLEKLMEKVVDSEEDEIYLAHESNPPSPDIYNWEKVDKENTSLAMAVFGIGIDMEKASIEFYEKAKADTKIEAARDLYDLLIKWERVHLEQFTEQYEMYRNEWWDEQNFAPF